MQYDFLKYEDMQEVRDNIVDRTCQYLNDYPNIKSLIMGISGGADSALVCVLSVLVRARLNRKINIIARSLPIESNKQDEIDRARAIGNSFDVEFQEADLSILYRTAVNTFNELSKDTSHAHKVRLGNIKARTRMMYLYNLASLNNGMVMSTDNYTELLLGFWTLHGDVGDFGMIQNLWKTEVFSMLDYHCFEHNQGRWSKEQADALRACRYAVPTDGLGITSSDLEQLGDISSYEQVDKILLNMLKNGYAPYIKAGSVPKVLTMYENTMYKRENPYNIPREDILK